MIRLGEICAFGHTPDSRIWLPCDGTFLETTIHPALFSLLGYTHGGDGGVFAVPNYNLFNDGKTPLYYIAIAGALIDQTNLSLSLNQPTREANGKFAR
jgi:microcystin-dependent protein